MSEPPHLFTTPTFVGWWQPNGTTVRFATVHRPNWLHRLANRVLIGWTWSEGIL